MSNNNNTIGQPGQEKSSRKDDDYNQNQDGERKGFFHINRNTLPLKITLSLFYGAMAAILPYLTIHMRDIGISLTQIATIYAVLPFAAFLGPPIMGIMADKMGEYKSVLVVATIITGISNTCLLLVPKYSESLVYSSALIEFGAGITGDAVILRPQSTKLCNAFDKSLRFSGNIPFENQIINIHTCKESHNNLVTRSFPRELRPISDIPLTCKWEVSADNEEVSMNHGYTCGDNWSGSNSNNKKNVEAPSSFMGGRSIGSSSGEKCFLNVRINSGYKKEEGLRRKFPSVTCQTNYTFPTGDKVTNGNGQLTFWLYFVVRTISNIFMSSCFTLLDATTLAVVAKNKGSDYGKERIMCTLGFAIVSPLAGLLVDQVSAVKGYTDYSASFYFSNILIAFNVLGYFFMKLDIEKPEENVWKNAVVLLNYPEVVVFLGMIFVLGNMWGFVESYLYIFLDELNAPKYLLGLTVTVTSLTSIPILYGANVIVEKVGRVNIIVSSFLIYLIRCVGYSYIPNPFWCFPFEAMEAFTYQLMWVAAATYCAVLAPKGLLATLTGVMGSLHYGLGKGSGAFIGGYLITMVSTRESFRYFGIASGIVGVIYFFINMFWLEPTIKRRNKRDNAANFEGDEQMQNMLTEDSNQKRHTNA